MNSKIILVILAAIVIGFFAFTYQVDERESALKLKFGKVDKTNIEPGLHPKIPIYNTIKKFDNRILTLDVPPTEFPTSE